MDQLITTRKGPIVRLAFNRPRTLNAFSPDMLKALIAAIGEATQDQNTRVIVLEGEGRAFSAGVDLKALQGAAPVAGRIAHVFDEAAQSAAETVRCCRLPVIAKVHGYCFTGALELALHCDFIFTTVDTKFGDTHVKWGLRPTWGMSQNLARAVGVRRARELSFSARTFTGAEAEAWGLANAAVADKAALDALVETRAGEIAAASPGAVAAYKKLYRLHEEYRPLEDALVEEIRQDFPEITDTVERLKGFGA
ncbi:enoyl-CoA hydratase/isomerase family protein [Amphiplicatus metriothermophilus]|uniref:Enoyl-CoA hydratase/carnithine racemase n=1 Tax=Amphiplicatus metriothermophilus TaxID=1519374 RepID=A0A239PJ67_9PROT|nr:enoyl-CoA hydratase/isomerase family protein [Amphiplicatus metriothermophilus]MBB5517825.1 enoyl-CoA hydratase/carnithine racemase [Amphiplicatus metriothermophilus]SNT67841.1 Enoyl-CoA hydratase/carnithine racemase [Amphiplicatus metriothermophilus]